MKTATIYLGIWEAILLAIAIFVWQKDDPQWEITQWIATIALIVPLIFLYIFWRMRRKIRKKIEEEKREFSDRFFEQRKN
ncbi:MAG: hypothetical protein NUV82_02365 [Candidatus Komeilibacteria bacterium]|nr:hypothetical protein [Candidatus Komeilibacteria bacterium]